MQIHTLETHFQASNSDLLSSRAALDQTQSRLCSLEAFLSQTPKRSYDDEYVLNLISEAEDEAKLRCEIEARADNVERRLRDVLSGQSGKERDDLEIFDNSHEILRSRLGHSQSDLRSSQDTLVSLKADQDVLNIHLGQVRAALTNNDEQNASLRSELATACSINEIKDKQLLEARESLNRSRDEIADKEGELLAVLAELESLKRDATILRDQLISLQQQQQLGAGRKTPSPPKSRHYRTSSAPFSPSPLRHASFPAPPSSSSDPPSTTPNSVFLDVPNKDEQSLVLVSRLRQEREEAVSQLSYYLLEHRFTAQCIQDELEKATAEREISNRELENLAQENKDARARFQEAIKIAQDKEEDAREELRAALVQLARLQTAYDEQPLAAPIDDTPSFSQDQPICHPQAKVDPSEAILASTKLTVAEMATQIKVLFAERNDLADLLSTSKGELRGARNAALDLQTRFDDAQIDVADLQRVSTEEAAVLQDQTACLELQLEGARNAALELETKYTDLREMKDMLETSLSQQRETVFHQLLVELAAKDVLQSQMAELKTDRGEMHGRFEAEKAQNSNLIVALIQAGHQTSAVNETVRSLRTQLQAARAGLAEAHVQLASMDAQQAALGNSSEQQEISRILSLIQASAELARLRRVVSEQSSRLHAEVINRNQLDLKLETAQQTILGLEDQLAQQQLSKAAAQSENLQEQVEDLSKQLTAAQEVVDAQQIQLVSAEERHMLTLEEVEQLRPAVVELNSAQAEISSIRRNETALRMHAEEAARQAIQQDDEVRRLEEMLATTRQELVCLQKSLAKSQEEVETLGNRLKIAEDEGRNLVTDFNILSEELETCQKEDETRCVRLSRPIRLYMPSTGTGVSRMVHTDLQQQRLAEAEATQLELTQKSDDATNAIRDMEARLKQLEEELENKQMEVEEASRRTRLSLGVTRADARC